MIDIASELLIAGVNTKLSKKMRTAVFEQCIDIEPGKYDVVQLDCGTRVEYHCVSINSESFPDHVQVYVDGKLKFDIVQ